MRPGRITAVAVAVGMCGSMLAGSPAPAGAQVPTDHTLLAGNFAGGPRDELFYYEPGAGPEGLFVITMVGGVPQIELRGEFAVNGTYTPLVGDYDGDGFDEILWYAPGSTADYLQDFPAGGGTAASTRHTVNGATYLPFSADIFRDGAGSEDIFWYAPGLAADSLWDFYLGSLFKHPDVVDGDYVATAGDFFGDGAEDLVFENDAELLIYEHRIVPEGVQRFGWIFGGTPASADARTTAEAGAAAALPSGPAELTGESTIVRP